MAPWLPLFADNSAAQQGGPPPFAMWVPIAVLGAMFLMFMWTSGKQKRELQKARAGLKNNDRVVTTAGIVGIIVGLKENEDEVTLKSEDARIRVLKNSIVQITSGNTTVGDTKS